MARIVILILDFVMNSKNIFIIIKTLDSIKDYHLMMMLNGIIVECGIDRAKVIDS
jgi:hypothetical protein